MKKGINIWSFPKGMKIEDCMRLAKKAGFEGIELSLNETGELSLESTDAEVRGYLAAAKACGIEITSLATGLYWEYSLTSGKEALREKAKSILKKQIDFAALLEVDTILVVPGAVGVGFRQDGEVVDYEAAYERSLSALREAAPYAMEKRVTIGIENVWNKFLLSPLETRDFIDKVGSDYVGAYLDVGNVVAFGYPEQWVRILGGRIKKVHLKDYKSAVGTVSGFVDLLSGDVNFPAVTAELKKAGYTGYLIAEMIPPYKQYSDQIIYNTSASMDRILER